MIRCRGNLDKLGLPRPDDWVTEDSSASWLKTLKNKGAKLLHWTSCFSLLVESELLQTLSPSISLYFLLAFTEIFSFSALVGPLLVSHCIFLFPIAKCNAGRGTMVRGVYPAV